MKLYEVLFLILIISIFTNEIEAVGYSSEVDKVVKQDDSASYQVLMQASQIDVVLSIISKIENDTTYHNRTRRLKTLDILKRFNVLNYEEGRNFIIHSLSDSTLGYPCLYTLAGLPKEFQPDAIEVLLPLLYGNEKGEKFKEWSLRILEKYEYQSEELLNYQYQVFTNNNYDYWFRMKAAHIYSSHKGIKNLLDSKSSLNTDGTKALTFALMKFLIKTKEAKQPIDSTSLLKIKQFLKLSFEIQDISLRKNLMDLMGLTYQADEYYVLSNNKYIPNPEIYNLIKKAS